MLAYGSMAYVLVGRARREARVDGWKGRKIGKEGMGSIGEEGKEGRRSIREEMKELKGRM